MFRDVFQSDLGQYFVEKGEDVVPLNIVGHLFNHIGNCILNSIKRDKNKQVFHPLTKVVEIIIIDKNEYLVKCYQYKSIIQAVKPAKQVKRVNTKEFNESNKCNKEEIEAKNTEEWKESKESDLPELNLEINEERQDENKEDLKQIDESKEK